MNILMFGHDGSLNRGCEAIVKSSSNIIKENIKDSKIILASGKPDTDKHIKSLDEIFDSNPIDFKPNIIEKLLCVFQLRVLKSENYALKKINKKVIKNIDNIDVFLSIGGDNYCYGEQPSFYEINRNVKNKGKKLVLWGCSIGEEDITEKKLKDLKSFDLILARESLTYEMLKTKGITNIELCADPAFTMVKEELPLPNGWKVEDTIGINFSPLVLKRNEESEQAVRELIKYILKTTESTIALTPHVIIEGNNDFETLKKYYEEFKHTRRVIILPDNLTAIQYKGYIARMRCFIGARTHATIAAYSNCVPTMVLGYSVKSRGIAKDLFGEEKLVLGIKDISDKNKLINSFNEMIRNEDDIKNTLKTIIPKTKEKAYKMAESLERLAN